jgi:ribosomal protein S18 acetylase RimI-like enzyme
MKAPSCAPPPSTTFLQRMVWLAILASPRFVAASGIERLREIEAERWASWPQTDESAFVAEDAHGRFIGALVLHVHERDEARVVGYRLAIGVEEAARGKGIGRRLVEHAKRYSVEAGADYLFLFVDSSNELAIHLYEAAGFEHSDPRGVIPMIVRFREQSPG